MKIDIYRSEGNSSKFYVIPNESDAAILPEHVFILESSIDIEEGTRLIGLDCAETIRDIEQSGFHIAYVRVTFDEMTSTTDTVVLERADK